MDTCLKYAPLAGWDSLYTACIPWQVCDFHCENLAQVKNHLELVRHSKLARAGSLTTTLLGLPPARDGHLAGIQDMLENVQQVDAFPDLLMANENIWIAILRHWWPCPSPVLLPCSRRD